MSEQEFVEYVEQGCPEELVAYVSKAVEIFGELFQKNGQYYSYKRASVTEFIGRLAPLLAKENDRVQPGLKITPSDVLTSDFLADKISPWVEFVRKKLFESPQAHFKSIEEAIKWIEDEDKKRPAKKTTEEIEEGLQLSKRLIEITGSRVRQERELLPYPGKDGWLRHIPVWPGTSVGFLSDQTSKMSKATGFSQVSLVMYVLADIKPLLSRVRLTLNPEYYNLPTGGTLETRSMTLDIKARDLSFRELREIYESIRKGLLVKKSKPLNERHQKLYQIVQEKGGAPKTKERGTVAFWISVMDEMNEWNRREKRRYRAYTEWRAVKKAYKELIVRLEAQFSGSPRTMLSELADEYETKREGERR